MNGHEHQPEHDAHQHGHQHEHQHEHAHVHIDEADWERWAAGAECEGEVLLQFVTDAATSMAAASAGGGDGPLRIFDIGSGPGVGSCELARMFPTASVVAIDGSSAMLRRAAHRAERLALSGRVSTKVHELPGAIEGLGTADMVWASMSLHHVGDMRAALGTLYGMLDAGGVLGVAEMADPLRFLPEDLGVGSPGLGARVDAASREWFASMRHGLHLPGEHGDLDEIGTMLAEVGFEPVVDEVRRVHLDAPLSDLARQFVVSMLERTREQLASRLDADDVAALDQLLDPEHPMGLHRRADLSITAWRRILVVRRPVE